MKSLGGFQSRRWSELRLPPKTISRARRKDSSKCLSPLPLADTRHNMQPPHHEFASFQCRLQIPQHKLDPQWKPGLSIDASGRLNMSPGALLVFIRSQIQSRPSVSTNQTSPRHCIRGSSCFLVLIANILKMWHLDF